MNCMMVFHFIAAKIKDVPLFESCADQDLSNSNEEGAIYNDFDGNNISLLDKDDFLQSQLIDYNNSQEMNLDSTAVNEQDIDTLFLQADEDDFTRWDIPSEYFEKDLPPNDFIYISKVHHLVNNDEEMDLHLYTDHINR